MKELLKYYSLCVFGRIYVDLVLSLKMTKVQNSGGEISKMPILANFLAFILSDSIDFLYTSNKVKINILHNIHQSIKALTLC